MRKLRRLLRPLKDPRADNIRHDLADILIIALAATLAGAKTCTEFEFFGRGREELLRGFLELRAAGSSRPRRRLSTAPGSPRERASGGHPLTAAPSAGRPSLPRRRNWRSNSASPPSLRWPHRQLESQYRQNL